MKYLIVFLVSTIALQSIAFSQCLDINKIKTGGDYGVVKYMFLCPTYSFAYNGDTSRNWNLLNSAIDIKQAPPKAMEYKNAVEQAIRNYSGLEFYADLKFIDVEIGYPGRYKAFRDAGRPDIKHRSSKAKYFYHYQFSPNDTSVYLIGIAVSKKGRIISPFTFPSKKDYKPIDKHFSYCKLINIARQTQKEIDPIEWISLEYNELKKTFYWLISRKLVDPKEGRNVINRVEIDAANLTESKQIKFETFVSF